MSAVSMKVTPRSRARWMVAIDSSQSVAPYHRSSPCRPGPGRTRSTGRVWWCACLLVLLLECGVLQHSGLRHGVLRHGVLLREGQAVGVVLDLRVEQLQALPLAGEGPAHRLAVLLEQLDAFGLTR